MEGKAKEARELVARAEKKLGQNRFMAMFGNKYEDAAELLEKAANGFKLAKQWDEAGRAYERLAECHVHLESPHEAATALFDGANALKKASPEGAVGLMKRAAELYCNMGRLGMAAKNFRECAEILEKGGDRDGAMQYYEQASELYQTEEMRAETNKCTVKMATLSAEAEDFARSMALWEELARASVDNNLLKYSVKGYLLNGGLCALCCGDLDKIRNTIDRYDDLDATFNGTREFTFLKDLADAMEEGDQEQFTAVVAEFDQITRLDPWKTSLLLKAKKSIAALEAQEEDLT